MSEPTPGPWRWADWSAPFGTLEDVRNMRTLEYNPDVRTPGPIVRVRDSEAVRVLVVDDEIGSPDAELIRSAPELREALAEMLSMFGGNMDRADFERMSALVNGGGDDE